ncbi:MAG: cytochrome-c peroxidase [Pirellulaceae bacterium]|nr:cytochrome-c peroxidase [Pirellulaceae bacterium]
MNGCIVRSIFLVCCVSAAGLLADRDLWADGGLLATQGLPADQAAGSRSAQSPTSRAAAGAAPVNVTVNAPVNVTENVTERVLNLPTVPHDYAPADLPQHFRSAARFRDNTPDSNPITNAGATLGRVLFYDRYLSANQKTACADCHQQRFAFTDDQKTSVGFDGQRVRRNSMSLVNVRYYRSGRMFWDERADSLEQQVLMPIENKIEMGNDLDRLIVQLSNDPIYPPLFDQAFGNRTVTKNRMGRALAQFVRAIVSYRSKYDVGRAAVENVTDPFPNFTPQENLGKEQFFGRGQCANCHLEQAPDEGHDQSAFFYLLRPAVNGIDSDSDEADRGVADYSDLAGDVGRFKVPSLRNIQLTAPYMHDGRFHTLDQVIEHYNWSVRPHPNLDPRLDDFAANGMALPEREKVALNQFLLTLTDEPLIADPKFSDPFQRTGGNHGANDPKDSPSDQGGPNGSVGIEIE